MNLDLVFMEKYEIQKLRDLPIEGVAEQLGMVVKRHKALCPFHDDHHASLSFNTRKNNCRCYVCMGDSVGTIDLVMKYLGKDFLSACRWLAEVNGVYLEDSHPKVVSSSPISLSSSSSETSSETSSKASPKASLSSSFDAGKYARFFEHPWLNGAARRFLFEERRIDERVARWCRLTSWTDRKGVNWLQIPYFDMEGKLIGIQNRNLDYKKNQEKIVDSKGSSSSEDSKDAEYSKAAPRFRFPYGARCSIYNLPVVKMLKPEDKKWLAEIGEKLHTEWHMFPDRDAPGESLFMQLKEILPQLVHHQLPPECKDFSEYYLKEKK